MRIAIASGKGGTGKTTLAVNLAMLAAETEQVLLLDLDVEEPNSSLFIKGELKEETQMGRMVPKWDKQACTLCGRCSQVCRFNAVLKLGDRIMVLPELCHSCYACSELCSAAALPMQKMPLGSLKQYRRDKLTFLESKLEIGVEQASPLIRLSLDFVDRNLPGCDYQFLDCPPGTSCSMISATKTADYVILVTEPTPFGLHDLGLAVKTMRQLGKPFGVVVNRVGIGNAEVFAYCQREQIEIIGKIANSRELAELYSRGELLYSHSREFYRAMEGILEHLRGLV